MIDVFNDTPLCRSEYLLFELIKRNQPKEIYEVYGDTIRSSTTPTPTNPATITDVVYTSTRTGYGTVLRSHGTYKDKIYVNQIEEIAYIERNIGYLELDGTENWTLYNPPEAPEQGICYMLNLNDMRLGLQMSFSSHYKNEDNCWAMYYAHLMGIYTDHNGFYSKYFRKPNAECDTLDKFKAWLLQKKNDGDPVKFYYVLASTQTEQLEYIG